MIQNIAIKKILLFSNTVSVMQIKGTLSGLGQFLATENPLKMMKNSFYFTLKAFFILKVFQFLS